MSEKDSQPPTRCAAGRAESLVVRGARDPADVEAADERAYAHALGRQLRAVRSERRLSLAAVERESGGRWKAVVVGSYERGDRAVSVARLAELAGFYGVPVSELLPRADGAADRPVSHVVLDLHTLLSAPADEVATLIRYAQSIQRRRRDYGNQVLSLRGADLRALAMMFGISVEQLIEKLLGWGVLAASSLGPDHA
jgi:transcriptional regulator with XRE-family HTH domain